MDPIVKIMKSVTRWRECLSCVFKALIHLVVIFPVGIAVLTISNNTKHRGMLRRKLHGPSMRRRELIVFKIPVPFPGHLSQSGPQPAGVLSEQQQSYLVMFVGD